MANPASSSTRTTIGLFGGTFDPVHKGHLQIALDLKRHLRLDQMRLIPCHIPPHRHATVASAAQRAEMLALATAEYPELVIDEIELNNPEPSFSVNTLIALRQELGEEVSLCLAMGMDSLVNLATWYRWQQVLELAHIIVAARPGWDIPEQGEIANYLEQHRGYSEQLRELSRGKIVVQELTLLPISSTEIRAHIERGDSVQDLVPDSVWRYIKQHQLYNAHCPPR